MGFQSLSGKKQVKIEVPEIFAPLYNPYRHKVVYGGRAGGKSHAIAEALLILGMQSPLFIVCVREFQTSIADSVKKLLENKIKQYGLENFYEILKTEIRAINGTLVIFKGLNDRSSDTLKSLEGAKIVWVEEADSVSDDSLTTLIPTVRTEGSEIWYSLNLKYEDSAVYKRFIENPSKNSDDTIVWKVNYYDNPHLPKTILKEIEWDKENRPEDFAHVWLGELKSYSDSRVFLNWIVEEFVAKHNQVFYLGADFGFSKDASTMIRCYTDEPNRRLYIDYEAYSPNIELDKLPAFYDKFIPDCRKWKVIADSSRPDTISYLRKHGFKFMPSKKGRGSIEDGIEFIKKYKVVIHPRCVKTVEEFKNYSYKTNKKTGEVLPVVKDDYNHIIDALRYALEQRLQGFVYC